jgi:hypothetical protein
MFLDFYGLKEQSFNQRVTDTASDWLAVSSDITPNFGDYTDNYATPVPASSSPTEDDPLFVAWSDGGRNDPQPFESHAPLPPKSH